MITKDQVQKFQTELGVVLEELCKKHGMTVGNNDVTFKLNVEFGEATGCSFTDDFDEDFEEYDDDVDDDAFPFWD